MHDKVRMILQYCLTKIEEEGKSKFDTVICFYGVELLAHYFLVLNSVIYNAVQAVFSDLYQDSASIFLCTIHNVIAAV